MSWIGAAVPVGDEVFFYYGGYARGHKVEPATERQIGLARMKRDRYLALAPSGDEGTLVTRPFLVPGGRLTVNARATRGAVLVRLLDAEGKPLDDLGAADASPLDGDVLAGEVRGRGRWRGCAASPCGWSSGCGGRRSSASSSLAVGDDFGGQLVEVQRGLHHTAAHRVGLRLPQPGPVRHGAEEVVDVPHAPADGRLHLLERGVGGRRCSGRPWPAGADEPLGARAAPGRPSP